MNKMALSRSPRPAACTLSIVIAAATALAQQPAANQRTKAELNDDNFGQRTVDYPMTWLVAVVDPHAPAESAKLVGAVTEAEAVVNGNAPSQTVAAFVVQARTTASERLIKAFEIEQWMQSGDGPVLVLVKPMGSDGHRVSRADQDHPADRSQVLQFLIGYLADSGSACPANSAAARQ
jgi:hypothetical protein